ncbi:hypothetical protein ACWGR4_42445 [Embleya sp. NPDC055664]|uniref:hypothetical protein n=1 Tax=Embleya sp. NPDC059237 TaxID=3346784 RepID=UPI0036BA325D
MPDTEVRSKHRPHDDHHGMHSPPRVVVRESDMRPSDEDATSEQTAHAYETSQAEGDRTEDEDEDG